MGHRNSRWVQEDHELRQTAGRQISTFTSSMSTLSPKIVRYKKERKPSYKFKKKHLLTICPLFLQLILTLSNTQTFLFLYCLANIPESPSMSSFPFTMGFSKHQSFPLDFVCSSFQILTNRPGAAQPCESNTLRSQ